MEYRRLGSSGLQVSTVGLGTNNFGSRMEAEADCIKVLRHAVDIGINFIDTANVYGDKLSEQFIGNGIKGIRDKVVIATKVYSPMGEGPNQKGASRLHIMREVENSLKRLQTDYIDLYQIHFWDADTPLEETLRALDDLVRQGKVRYIGCSNFMAWQACQSLCISQTLNLEPFVTVQAQWSMISRGIERELVPFCQAFNVGIIPYFPLAGGFLTGKYRRGEPVPEGSRFQMNPRFGERALTDKNFDMLDRIEQFAAERGHPVAELAIAWLLYNPIVSSVIVGATKPEQVSASAKAIDWHLTAQEMEELEGILSGGRGVPTFRNPTDYT